MEEDRIALGERVRIARLERGWGKEGAARAAGISAITWKRVEDGLNVQDHKLWAVLKTLGLERGHALAPAAEPPLHENRTGT